MDEEQFQSRISQIATRWSLLRPAEGGADGDAPGAESALVERYMGAVYRYLFAILKDGDAAEEVCQSFLLRFVRGDLRAATPEKGKFRSYLKTVLSRMAIDHFRRRKREWSRRGSHEQLVDELAKQTTEAEFERNWTAELLQHALAGLKSMEEQSGQPYHTILRLQMEDEKRSAQQTAEYLNETLRPRHPYSEPGVRKILQRARERFADLLIQEVELSLQTSDLDEVEAELSDLGLLVYCRKAVARRRGSVAD